MTDTWLMLTLRDARGLLIAGKVTWDIFPSRDKLPDVTYYRLVHHTDGSNYFECSVLHEGAPTKIFSTKDRSTTDFFEVVDSLLGESTPLGICRALQVPPEYLDLR